MSELDALFSPRSRVLDVPAAKPADALRFFLGKLGYEVDPYDVWDDMNNGVTGFEVIDTRDREAYEAAHVPGARNIWHPDITPESVGDLGLDENTLYITYCWGPHCNAATKGAAKLAALGFRVKEMIGGIEGWRTDGYPVEKGL